LFLAVPVFRSICSILELESSILLLAAFFELEPSILLLFAALEPSILFAICSILELESCICHAICKPLLVVSCCLLVVGWCSWRNTPTTADGFLSLGVGSACDFLMLVVLVAVNTNKAMKSRNP